MEGTSEQEIRPESDQEISQEEEEARSISNSIKTMVDNLPPEDTVGSINNSIKTMFDNVPPLLSAYSIYRVPERLRNVKEEAYTPMVVSIGPYHHGKEKYKTMEYHKLRYLYSNLVRDCSMPLHDCVKLVLGLERSARECYAEAIFITKEEFVTMMLVDGFFIVELIRQYHNPDLRNKLDPIFKNPWIFNAVHRDMLLLENQLPFFVLDKLYTLISDSAGERYHTCIPSFFELTNGFLGYYQPIRVGLANNNIGGHHLVHLVLQSFTSPMPKPKIMFPKDSKDLAFIPSATELHEAGIKFRGVASVHLTDVKFIEGVLQIPPLLVDDRTESLFRNLIAMEQSHSSSSINVRKKNILLSNSPLQALNKSTPETENQRFGGSTRVSDYVTLMDCLINTSADVALLRDRGVIHNWLGDNKEVAQLFNKLRSGIIACPTEFYFSQLFADVNKFYNTRWHALKAKLKRDYFNTPWASLSFVAAVFLLTCTSVQTVCSILQVV